MRLPFFGRTREKAKCLRALQAKEGQLVCLVGRRRLGKSRLLMEILRELPHVYVVGEPARSRLGAGQVDGVLMDIQQRWSVYLGGVWEGLARESVSRMKIAGESWFPAQSWWGAGLDRRMLEIDLLARHGSDPDRVLVGEAKIHATPDEIPRLVAALVDRAGRCPALVGKRLDVRLWVLEGVEPDPDRVVAGREVFGV